MADTRVQVHFHKSNKVRLLGRQRYYFTINSPNGRVLCSSELYHNVWDMEYAGWLASGASKPEAGDVETIRHY